ncbi:STAS domain-containing protein [Acidiferrimicrobium sp. IK]|uniref:STAS domain-containing protein n=1 Tax=Acidiferrimicrobium sp. IK TaxID=2871700 RepID=UPI0021CB2292|nr:STAS domain-containing protein [Acidiferrimicrobium sp. IK]MCU4182856.1 STAS domain-containing protein [Acidiferrimicrobium sp. IK]
MITTDETTADETTADETTTDSAGLRHRPHDLTVEVTTEQGARCIHARGRLDWVTVDRLRPALATCRGESDVVLDLGEVESLDSAGTGLVLSSIARHTGAGGAMALVARHPEVRQVLLAVGACDVAPLSSSVDEACGRLPSAAANPPA